jgi:hypothetical protein
MKKLYFILLLALISFNCQKELTAPESLLPTITTAATTSITNTTALSGGNITDDGGATITARGVCWALTPDPVVTGNHTIDGTGTGIFASNITGLTANTVYHVRAYATNSVGTTYGADSGFTTTNSSTALPTVTTLQITGMSLATASGGGNVTADGGATVTARGVCWSTTANPVATGNHTTDGTGTGSFISAITGLTGGTTYHVRAYATNSVGTAYGGDSVFTTTATAGLPTVTTASIGTITALTASGGGTVTADGGATVTIRGLCWSTTANPVATGNHTTDGSGIGTFAGFITGLTPGTTYHVRAYATNSVGTAYGGDSTFTTTTVTPPTVQVYAAGYENNGSKDVAKYWKNSVAVNLTDGSNNAEANSIFINGTDVYVAGWEMQGTKKVAKYWKNSVAVNLTDGSNNAEATQIIVAGTDIYVSGREATATSIGQAKYWKNGSAVNLAASATEISFAKSIAVAGTDVYVAVSISGASATMYAVIIKNGVVTDLSGGFVASAANAVFLQGSDVYVAGRHGFYQATYWKNNVVINLPSSETNTETGAFSIFVSGTDVYVSGFEKTSLAFGNIEVAKYWKNGIATNLTNAVFHASAEAITVSGSDIYAAGYEENAAGNGIAKYWKNGVAFNLTDGSKDAGAYSIIVK